MMYREPGRARFGHCCGKPVAGVFAAFAIPVCNEMDLK
ncbi:Unknown protein sequence [Pseudomonas syringae pv. maculicola]|nr:Unknown protein sequence [Pseudomonas savastanoi pv. phaseolicola]KPB37771.1 Unknown protein sequence [Pseudomonas savastanoi pv. phaseolicola]KPB53748.1 Unknown protein sequence [Pseudomonas amygdali pv. myricae]KPB70764.1 Unknown protein sequence [Pseudomonas amygdali pv. mellea]KPB88238.1 Unknown protein sequence [Pseudomonas syringae pv. maculicola]